MTNEERTYTQAEMDELTALIEAERASNKQQSEEFERKELERLRRDILTEAGYKGEQIERALKFVNTNEESAMRKQVEELQMIAPANHYVDPSVNAPGGVKRLNLTDIKENKGREAARKLFKRK